MAALFVCDINLPPCLVSFFASGISRPFTLNDAGLATASDRMIWDFALERGAIIVTKDSDFVRMEAVETGPRIIMVCTGNCSNRTLLAKFSTLLPEILTLFETGSRIVELR